MLVVAVVSAGLATGDPAVSTGPRLRFITLGTFGFHSSLTNKPVQRPNSKAGGATGK